MTTTLGIAIGADIDRSAEIEGVLLALGVITREERLATRAIEKELGISLAQLRVLRILEVEPEPLCLNDLAERTATHQSSTSVVVSRLAAKGLITTGMDKKDKRVMRIGISEDGKLRLARAPLTVTERIEQALARMSPTHRRQLRSLLQGLVVDAGYTLLGSIRGI